MSAALEAIVVRQLAGLRAANWSLGDAIEFVHGELPESATKARLHAALASLRAGTPQPTSDALVATLTRGDAASALVLEQLAEALEAADEARTATTLVRAAITVVLCLCTLVVMRVTGSVVASFENLFSDFGASLPAPTQLFMDLSGPMQVLAPVLLVGALVVVWRARFEAVTGGRELRASSLLFQFASAVEAGVAEPAALALIDPAAQQLARSRVLQLDAVEQVFLGHVMTTTGAAGAARQLALELRARGSQLASEGRWWRSPALIVVVVLTALFVSSALVAMYLPIFALSGAIR